MDLNELKLKDTAVVEILHPVTGEPLGIRITIHSSDSDVARNMIRAQATTRLHHLRSKKRSILTQEEVEAEGTEYLVKCTVGWEGVEENGTPLSATPENLRRVYSTPAYRWLRQQVDEAIAERGLFFDIKPKSSSNTPGTSSDSRESTS